MTINTLEDYKAAEKEILDVIKRDDDVSRRMSPSKVNAFITAKNNLELIVKEYGGDHKYSKEAVKVVVYRIQALKDHLDDVKFKVNSGM